MFRTGAVLSVFGLAATSVVSAQSPEERAAARD